ncbi:hypothetical protein OY671_007929 [Metschnikowia pulcherrima]|nr:hypothetical protein OY671_007929 [Metschnikowia pulcherrima]
MTHIRFRPVRAAAPSSRRGLAVLASPSSSAACASSPPVHYYTSQGPAPQAPAVPRAAAPFSSEVQGVNVAAQADQPQSMVRTGDGSVAASYSERWSSPSGDEIRGALSDALKHDSGALDVQVVKPGPSAPSWRVQTDVQRFDSVSGRMAQSDATWRVRPVNLKGNGSSCRSVVTETVSEAGVPASVAAQQRAVAASAGDPDVARHSGAVSVAASVAQEYGFADTDGKIPRALTLADV